MGMMSDLAQIRDEVCQNYCKHAEEVLNEGYEEDAFFDRMNDLYCCECPLANLDEYIFTCNDCKSVSCQSCPAYSKGCDQACQDAAEKR